MEPPKKNPPQKRFHGICFHHNFLSKNQSKNLAGSEKRERATLLKYFPKHISKLHFKFSDGPLNTRIKHLKFTQKLSCTSPHNNFWRIVAANKRKTVQYFHNQKDQNYSKFHIQCLKMFPNTKMIKLCLEDHEEFSPEEWDQQLYWINRISCYLNHLKNLKYLKLSLLSPDVFGPLSKLKNSQRILSHLKTFEIHLNLSHSKTFFCINKFFFTDLHKNSDLLITPFQSTTKIALYYGKGLTWPNSEDHEVLHQFLTYKEILRNLTNLSLGMLAGKEFFEVFQLLSESCPRLSSLAFGTSQKDFYLPFQSPYEFEDDIELEDSAYLQCLQNFSNLKELYIRTCHGLDFLQYCEFPTSLRHLELCFWKIDWEDLKEASSKGFLEFNSQPENLQNLEKLQVGFQEFRESSTKKNSSHDRQIAINTFLQAFLKRILTCKELDLIISCPYTYENEFKDSPFQFDFADFLKYIEHFGHSLVTLKISDKSREYYFNDFNVKPGVFPRLSRFCLWSEISPNIDLENIFNFVQDKGENNEITLDGIKAKSSEELLNLLKKLGKIKNIVAEKKRVELEVSCLDLGGDEEYFERNYEEVKKDIGRLKNVFLTLRIKKSDSKFSEKLKSFKPLFGDLQIRGKNDWEKF